MLTDRDAKSPVVQSPRPTSPLILNSDKKDEQQQGEELMSISHGSSAVQAEREREKDLERQSIDNKRELHHHHHHHGRRESLGFIPVSNAAVARSSAKLFYIVLNTLSTVITVFLNKMYVLAKI